MADLKKKQSKGLLHHVKRHASSFATHMKLHHKKYLFGLVGGGLFVKLAIFMITGLGMSITLTTNADIQTGCYTTGQYVTGGYITGQSLTGAEFTGQYLTGGYYTGGYLTGAYTTGCYTTGGYYTGGYLSGEEMIDQSWTGEYQTGCYTTGEYFTGAEFTGQYLTGGYYTGGYLTGGFITGQYLTGGYQTGCITIPNNTGSNNTGATTGLVDTTKPTLTGIVVTLNGVVGNYIGINGIAKITFTASEELTGNVISFRGAASTLLSKSGLQYTYQQTLSNSNAEGLLGFSVAYNDLAGNTGFYTATGPIIFDKIAPAISGFTIGGDDQNGFTLSRQTTESTKYNLNYTITGLSTVAVTGTTYGTSFTYLITGITIGKSCNFQLNVLDRVGNTAQFSGKIDIGTNGIVAYNYGSAGSTLASMNTGTTYVAAGTGATTATTTGNLSSFAATLQKEINRYNICRDSVSYREVNLLIQGNDFALHMPQFQNDTVKKLVQAFTIYMVSKLKTENNLTIDDLNFLTKRFNNILVVLKLVRDENNECKQNLSSYHIMQFQNAMAEYGIELE